MAKSVDAPDLGSGPRQGVGVRLPLGALNCLSINRLKIYNASGANLRKLG